MSASVSIERKRVDCNALPKGWQREEMLRKSGISAGKVDVYYYSPTGKRIDTKPQLARYLGDSFDVVNFDFQTGKMQCYPHRWPLPPSISLFRCSGIGMGSGGGGGGVGITNTAAITPATAVTMFPPSSSSSSSVSVSLSSSSPSSLSGSIISSANNLTPGGGGCTAIAATTSNALKRKLKSSAVALPSSGGGGGGDGSPSGACVAGLRQQLDISRAIQSDATLVPPIRQTASIFKQPVTVERNHENAKAKPSEAQLNKQYPSLGLNAIEKPQQLFWEKRLERLRACHDNGEDCDEIALPKNIRAIGPNVNDQTVLRSLATALHMLNSTPVMGQTSTKAEFSKNANAFINPEQPLMQAVLLNEEDIRRQEDRVNTARRKLQEALVRV